MWHENPVSYIYIFTFIICATMFYQLNNSPLIDPLVSLIRPIYNVSKPVIILHGHSAKELRFFLCYCPQQAVEQTIELPLIGCATTVYLVPGVYYVIHALHSRHCIIFETLVVLKAYHRPSPLITIDRPYCYHKGGALPAKNRYPAHR